MFPSPIQGSMPIHPGSQFGLSVSRPNLNLYLTSKVSTRYKAPGMMYRAGMVPTDKDVIEVHECTHCCPEAIDHPIQMGYTILRHLSNYALRTYPGVLRNGETCHFNACRGKCAFLLSNTQRNHPPQPQSRDIDDLKIDPLSLSPATAVRSIILAGYFSCFISDFFFWPAAMQLIADSCSFPRETLTQIRKTLAIYHCRDNISHIYHKFARGVRTVNFCLRRN